MVVLNLRNDGHQGQKFVPRIHSAYSLTLSVVYPESITPSKRIWGFMALRILDISKGIIQSSNRKGSGIAERINHSAAL